MALMPPHRCLTCQRLITGRCPHCEQTRQRQRPTAAQRGYCSDGWRRLRNEKLAADPWCSVCGRLADEVDHLERPAGPNDPRFWDWSNLDSKCKRCHASKTATHDARWT
jgi:hypothetical protein